MNIKHAKQPDAQALYDFALTFPELQVSNTSAFMEFDEFALNITQPHKIFLVARDNSGTIAGFILATAKDADMEQRDKYACIVYLCVASEFRRHGVAKALLAKCELELKSLEITHMYSWANPAGGIIPFFIQQGFTKGHEYVWMDKKL